MSLPDDLLERALALPDEERLELLNRLAISLDSFGVEESDWADSLAEELNRRLRSIQDGTAVLIDSDEVMARLRESVRRRRGA
jgi:putative addiction module component (TIGR02574 family)